MAGSELVAPSRRLTLEGARVIVAAVEEKANQIGVPMDIAVVDDGGNLLAFERMDGAKITSIDIAINKAFTAACTRRPTADYAEIAGAGKPAFGIHVSNQGRFVIFGGGVPIFADGQPVGGVGCSSGSAEQDAACAQAGVDALMARLPGSS